MFLLVSSVVYGGTFYVVKEGKKVAAGTYETQEEFVQLLKGQMASAKDVTVEKKEIYGLMFFIMAAPKQSIERVVKKRIMDFYDFPGKYGFTKGEKDKLYRTKEELLKSAELTGKTKKHGHYEIFIIGVDVKYDRMHSISKANGVRFYLDRWYN